MPTAEEVMDMSRACLNDVNGTVFTNTALIPYLNMAIRALAQKLELNKIPVSNAMSAVIAVEANGDNIGGEDMGDPELPDGLVEIQQLWQRTTGTQDQFIPIAKFEFLPHYYDGIETTYIPCWAWIDQVIRFIPSNTPMDVKIDYIRNILPNVEDEDDDIKVFNSTNYLGFKTASFAARFIGENPGRAASLDGEAEVAFSEVLGIAAGGAQSITTRRRPYMMGYRNRVSF
jgi:hypothetical protein